MGNQEHVILKSAFTKLGSDDNKLYQALISDFNETSASISVKLSLRAGQRIRINIFVSEECSEVISIDSAIQSDTTITALAEIEKRTNSSLFWFGTKNYRIQFIGPFKVADSKESTRANPI